MQAKYIHLEEDKALLPCQSKAEKFTIFKNFNKKYSNHHKNFLKSNLH